jgi:hypothetical protein
VPKPTASVVSVELVKVLPVKLRLGLSFAVVENVLQPTPKHPCVLPVNNTLADAGADTKVSASPAAPKIDSNLIHAPLNLNSNNLTIPPNFK